MGFPIECLKREDGYVHPPILTLNSTVVTSDCTVTFPAFSSIQKGEFNVEVTGCSVEELTFECFAGEILAACAAIFTVEKQEFIPSRVTSPIGVLRVDDQNVPPVVKGKDTLASLRDTSARFSLRT